MRTLPSTASHRPARCTLRGWKTTSPSERMTVVPRRAQRARVEPVRKRVVHQEERHPQQLRIVEVLEAIALQRAQVVGVSELRAQLLENRPVAVAAGAAELALQMSAEIGLHGVVVEQRIVHVEQEQ